MATADRRIDTVLFDIDDTLCRYRRSGAELLEIAFAAVGVDPFFDVDTYHARYGEFAAETDDVRELRERCFAAIARDRGRDPDLGRAVARAYAAERDHRNVEPMPGAVAAVEHIAADHRVGVVTNGAPGMQRQKLAAIGLADIFETVVHAGYDAPSKPSPEPFAMALADLDARSERAVHVGNSPTTDVRGARAAGLAAAWLAADRDAEPPSPEPAFTLVSMRELHAPPWR